MINPDEDEKLTLLKLKSQILILETKLKSENIKYRQNKLREQINLLRKEYMEKDIIDRPEINRIEPIDFDLGEDLKENIFFNIQSYIIQIDPSNIADVNFNRSYKKICLRNFKNLENLNISAENIEITDCDDLKLSIRAETIVLRNVTNSHLIIEGAQLRLQNTKYLHCLLKSPIATVLEKSINIQFQGHQGLKIDDCINDFDCPFGSPNFKII